MKDNKLPFNIPSRIDFTEKEIAYIWNNKKRTIDGYSYNWRKKEYVGDKPTIEEWTDEDTAFLKKYYRLTPTELMLCMNKPTIIIHKMKVELGLIDMPESSNTILVLADKAEALANEMKKKYDQTGNITYNKYNALFFNTFKCLLSHPIQADMEIRLKQKLRALLFRNALCRDIIENHAHKILSNGN